MAKSRTKSPNSTGSSALNWAGVTDPGRVRSVNQDAYFADPDSGLFIVSDGMGGEQAGALASKVVIRALPPMVLQRLAKLKKRSAVADRRELCGAIMELSQRLWIQSREQIDLQGMGATVVLALVRGRSVHIAHLGDSRACLIRKGKLVQLTDDHSIVGILLRNGEITSEEVCSHPARGQLSRFVGMEGEPLAEADTLALNQGDRLLLCSDGLTGMLSNMQIATLIENNPDCQETCKELVAAANARGGHDNITAVVLRWP